MRDRILDTTEELLVREGVNAIRLDAVAAKAGVSKGGLLHHFGTRQALIEGVVLRLVDAFEAYLPPRSSPPGAFTRAWLDATIPATDVPADGQGDRVAVALLAALSGGPEMLTLLRGHYLVWQDRLANDGLDPAAATLVRLAVDGWWLARVTDLAPPAGDLHVRIRASLDQLARTEND
ncbi:TetR/AcrR family transcriptional regulator [Solihabitans fulvus]|uniref:TetR/AcrR family transcriptional regulator n=1 Tax=Solihabitans fulvus TaxID=1892852 RepID=A0A5B2WGE5_9PSEU|nr:TetR/AcrR family transcriptional regulator [Solihabitans fulvus]KAA2250941.1 TetR/AcrR family transcriptional regulator [Solihabitans fulvus]